VIGTIWGGVIPFLQAKEDDMERAIFGAGCFWGVEEAFRQIPGVRETRVGYSGGAVIEPTYRDVCTGGTGHAEVVELIFDPKEVGYKELLTIFWEIHDPTQYNRQGPDRGKQYRSVIYYTTTTHGQQAYASKEALERAGVYGKPIQTQIEQAKDFYAAEEYHQKYFAKRGLPSCHVK